MARATPHWATALMQRYGLTVDDLVGFRFAINVAIASVILWEGLQLAGVHNPIWAIASMIAASEPEPVEARRMFRSRLINGSVGGLVGFLFLFIGGTAVWVLPAALATAVLLSVHLVRVKTMWRQAPVTAAVVIAASLTSGSARVGIEHGLLRVAEVIVGCVIGVAVSLAMSKIWLIRDPYRSYPALKSSA